jgi:hypothetical protein
VTSRPSCPQVLCIVGVFPIRHQPCASDLALVACLVGHPYLELVPECTVCSGWLVERSGGDHVGALRCGSDCGRNEVILARHYHWLSCSCKRLVAPPGLDEFLCTKRISHHIISYHIISYHIIAQRRGNDNNQFRADSNNPCKIRPRIP